MLKAIAGLWPVRAGVITFNGRDLTGLPPWEIHRLGVGLLLQGGPVFDDLTVKENLTVAASARGDRPAPSALQSILESLGPFGSQKASTLSGGERQLLSVAMMLRGNPSCLLLDEPSANLSAAKQEMLAAAIRGLMSEKGRVRTSLIVEQNVGFALPLATDVYRLVSGRLAKNKRARPR